MATTITVNELYHVHVVDRVVLSLSFSDCATHLHVADNVTMLESVPGYHYLGLCIELSRIAPTQYAGYNFNSMCKFGDVYLGANNFGVFVLDDGDKDNGADIYAFFELPTSDFGIPHQKRMRRGYVGYEADGDLKLYVKQDEQNERSFTLKPSAGASQYQEGAKVSITRSGKGRYWMFKVENVGGCDFSIDHITVVPIVLARKPSGA